MTSTNKIAITIHSDELSAKGIQNAVRRALSGDVQIPEQGSLTVKGLTITVKPVKTTPVPSKQNIRLWAAENGHPEVVGKRGRISADVLAAYEAAH